MTKVGTLAKRLTQLLVALALLRFTLIWRVVGDCARKAMMEFELKSVADVDAREADIRDYLWRELWRRGYYRDQQISAIVTATVIRMRGRLHEKEILASGSSSYMVVR